MKIIVDESPVGVGKTFRAIELMTGVPGRYVFATFKVEGMNEVADRIVEQAAKDGRPLPKIERVHSGNGNPATVARQISDLPKMAEAHPHYIAIISHEGMMSSEFSDFLDWTLIVDEVPAMFSMQVYRTPTDVAFFEENYTLTPMESVGGDSWRMVGLTAKGKLLEASDIAECAGHKYLHHFHRRCRDPRRGPVVSLEAWSDMAEPGRSWVWWSLFHPEQIAAFKLRYFLGNGFTKSLAFKLFDDPGIEWEKFSTMGSRPLMPRNARIVFYSDRPTSIWYFQSDEGQADMRKIAAHITSTTSADYFWSSNETIKGALETGLSSMAYRRPKQAGTSLLMHHDVAAMIYAAKPAPEVEQAIRGLGCERSDWVETNEYETVLQFVTRTSVRDVSSTRDVVLHVFNRDQAEYLKRFFDAQPHITATLERIDLGLSEPKAKGRPVEKLTDAERDAKRADRLAKRAESMRKLRAERKAMEDAQ